MKRKIIYTTLAFIIFTSNKAYPYDWTTETVSDVVSGYYASLAVDSGGDPFIAYKNPLSNSALKLAIKKNDSWNLLTVDDENPGSEHFALALNNQGMPRIAYEGDSDPKFASWNGWAWDLETIEDLSSQSAYSLSIAVDNSDVSHIAYRNYGLGQLTYANNNNGSWNAETIGYTSGPTSIVLDPYNNPAIAYNSGISVSAALAYAQKNTNGWDIQSIDSGRFWNSDDISMKLNSDGLPYIAYCQDSKLKYAYFDGDAWMSEVIYEDGFTIAPSLVLDSQDNAYISFLDDDLNKVMFASLIGNSWAFEPVFSSQGHSEINTSISLDDYGYAHIAHSSNGLIYSTAYIPEPATLLLLGLGGLLLRKHRR